MTDPVLVPLVIAMVSLLGIIGISYILHREFRMVAPKSRHKGKPVGTQLKRRHRYDDTQAPTKTIERRSLNPNWRHAMVTDIDKKGNEGR